MKVWIALVDLCCLTASLADTEILTVGDFWRHVARLGGYLGPRRGVAGSMFRP